MSRQSKNAKNMARARDFSKQRQSGSAGPAKTAAKHGKRWTYRTNPEIQKRIAEVIAASKGGQKPTGRGAAAKKILKGAGKAADA